MNKLGRISWKEEVYNLQMGSCVTNQKRPIQDTTPSYDQPIDNYPESDSSRTLQLTFHCLFSKPKLKRCPHYQQLQLGVALAELEPFELKTKFLVREAVKWEVEHFLELKITEHSLRRSFLSISVRTIEGKELAILKINLFLLATGPYHQEFAVPLPQAPSARLSFDIKISQMIHMGLSFQRVEMTPRGQIFPGDTFDFVLRAILGDKCEESDHSHKYVIGFEANQKIVQAVSQADSNLGGSSQQLPIFNMTSGNQLKISWENREEGKLPTIQAYAPYYQLEKASFNIVFYHFPREHKEFYSESYISFNKIAQHHTETRLDAATGINWLERQVQMELDCWDHGQQAGRVSLSFVFRVQQHIKQLKMCVRTEKGIQQAGPIFNQDKGDASFPAVLQELQTLTNEVQNLFMEAARQAQRLRTKKDKDLWTNKVISRLQRQEQILMSSSKQSQLMFVYKDMNSLLKGQSGLIELGFRTKDMLSQAHQTINACCWQILSALIKRSQLSLTHLGFNQQQMEEESKQVKAKRGVAVSFYNLLTDLLNLTLQTYEGESCHQKREFAEHFCAQAYFAMPQFRNKLLSAITRPQDPQMLQGDSNTQFNASEWIDSLSMKEISMPGRTSFSLRFDWDGSFIRPIQREEAFLSAERRLSELLQGSGWAQRMRRRGGAFFAFVRCWVGYVESTALNFQYIQWRYFPGYSRILHAFLAQLHLKPVESASEGLKQAASALLANEKLLSPFVVILLRKTNAMNQTSVAKTMEFIHHLFASISNRCDSLPAAFDVKYFLKGLKVVLEGESSYSIGKALLLLYDHFLLFPAEFRVEIALYLLSRVFFKLFLHWCSNVRALFHHILLARLYHQASLPLARYTPQEQQLHRAHPQYRTEIVFRYKKLMNVLDNAEEAAHKLQRHKVDVFEKDMYKRMRSRTNQRRRHSSTHPQDDKELMARLMQPRSISIVSQQTTKNLEELMQTQPKGSSSKEGFTQPKHRGNQRRHKRISYFDSHFESQLVPIKECQLVYVKTALEEYRKVNERFVEYLQSHAKSVPPVSVELSLDEKELRPQGRFKFEE